MTVRHIQSSYDDDIKSVHDKITIMAKMVSNELEGCINAFAARDQVGSEESAAADELINASERIIDELVIQAIVRHQPMASDMRVFVAALRISKDLERIGDYAKNIANHSSTLDHLNPTGEEQRVIDMGHAVITMLNEVIEAYSKKDTHLAETIRQQDIDIDELYTKIFADLLTINSENGKFAPACTHLSFIARSLERIGDHVTDIAEEVIYLKSGKFPSDDRAKADESAFVRG